MFREACVITIVRRCFPRTLTKLDWPFEGKNAPTAVIVICGRIVPQHAELQPTSFEYLLRDRNRLTNLPDSIEDLSRHAEPWSAIE